MDRIARYSSGKQIWRVASSTNLPYQDECALEHFTPTRDCFYPGIQPELLQFIAARLNVTLQIIPHPPYDFGDPLANGTWTGILDAINKGKVDTGSLFYLNYDKLNANFAVTQPCIYLSNYIIAPADHVSALGASLLLVNVFDILVWIMCIVACVVSVVPAMLMSNYALWKWKHQKRSQHWIDAFTGDGNQADIASSIRTLAVSLGFFIAIMFNLYTGILYTQLLGIPTTSLFSNHDAIQNLLTTASAKLYIRTKDLNHNEKFKNSSFTHVAIRGIGDHVNRKAIVVTDDESTILRGIDAHNGVAVFTNYKSAYLLRRYPGYNLKLVETSTGVSYSSLVFRNNSPMAQQVNKILTKYHAPIERLRQKYVTRLNVDSLINAKQSTSLQLTAFTGLISCAGAGLVIAIIVLLIERSIKFK